MSKDLIKGKGINYAGDLGWDFHSQRSTCLIECRNSKGMTVMPKGSGGSTDSRWEQKDDGGPDPTGILSAVVRDFVVKEFFLSMLFILLEDWHDLTCLNGSLWFLVEYKLRERKSVRGDHLSMSRAFSVSGKYKDFRCSTKLKLVRWLRISLWKDYTHTVFVSALVVGVFAKSITILAPG